MGKNDALEVGLRGVRDGRKTFGEFARETMPHWRALARYLLRRWRVAPWASVDDVVQDLLLAAWEHVWKWDERHPGAATLSKYVTYNALDKAKKRIHTYRGASRSGNADCNPSRIMPSPSRLWGEDAERRAEELTSVPPSQERQVMRAERVGRLIDGACSARERAVLRAALGNGELAEVLLGDDGALVRAALGVYSDGDARAACRLRTRTQALRAAVEAAKSAGERVEEMLLAEAS